MDFTGMCMGCFAEKGAGSDPCTYCGYRADEAAVSPHYLSPGTVLHDTYLVGRVLGRGGFGITYLAWDINLGIKLAIKEYFPREMATRTPGRTAVSVYEGKTGGEYAYGLEKFLQEARTLARFEGHPNIVAVRSFFQANDTAYMVMSFLEGISLEQYLHQAGGRLGAEQALQLIMPVADALKEVHGSGLLHRDISPDNILVTARGQVVLIDFGAARQAVSEKRKGLSVILKPGYAPEEQYRSGGVQGPWTDVYALGATIYHLLTGSRPLDSLDRLDEDHLLPPSALGVPVDSGLEHTVLQAMAVRSADRFQSIETFQEALLERKVEPRPPEAPPGQPAAPSIEPDAQPAHSAAVPVSPAQQPGRAAPPAFSPASHRGPLTVTLILTGAFLILFLLVVAGGALIYLGRERAEEPPGLNGPAPEGPVGPQADQPPDRTEDDPEPPPAAAALTPQEVVEEFLLATLGTLPGARVDYDYARTLMTPAYAAEFLSSEFVPESYGIHDGPERHNYALETSGRGAARVLAIGYWGGEPGKRWEFDLIDMDGTWKVSRISDLHEMPVPLVNGETAEVVPGEYAFTDYVIVDVDVLRLRDGPGTGYEIIDRLEGGTPLMVIASIHFMADGEREPWLQVVTPEGGIGWVHSGFVVNAGPAQDWQSAL